MCTFSSSSDQRPEQSIASARAQVMVYDDLNKKWMPSGTSHGLSKVHIYHHFLNSTFRVVGRKLGDHEVREPQQASSWGLKSCLSLGTQRFIMEVNVATAAACTQFSLPPPLF